MVNINLLIERLRNHKLILKQLIYSDICDKMRMLQNADHVGKLLALAYGVITVGKLIIITTSYNINTFNN